MAIKKCFVFVFIFVLIFSFASPVYAVDSPYFYPDQSQDIQLKKNFIFVYESILSSSSSDYAAPAYIPVDFQYNDNYQYYIYLSINSGSFYFPVNCLYDFYNGLYGYTFGVDFFIVDDSVSLDLKNDFGLVLVDLPDSDYYAPLFMWDSSLNDQYAYFGLTYLEKEPPTISDRVNQGILLVVELLGTFVSSFFARSGDLYPLLQLLLLGISVSVLVWVARAVKIFIWGY